MKQDIAIIGLSVMGSNLALNIADHNFKVAVYNRTQSVTENMVKQFPHENITPYFDLKTLVKNLTTPRKIMVMVKAGNAVDMVIEQLLPLLEKEDIIINGGNSFFKDTQRRYEYLKQKAIHYFGVGVSGGEEGARKGPALMPGGDENAYENIRPILEAIAAKVNGNPCCNYIATGGSGHYVKMVHNGIEYGDMQLISEAYMILKQLGGLTNSELQQVFEKFNTTELESYLIEITSNIFKVKENDSYLVDKILDKASQKGTGKWMNLEAIDLGVDISVISSALNARFNSNLKSERIQAEQLFKTKPIVKLEKQSLIELVQKSLYVAKILSYAQGFKLLKQAQEQYGWTLNYANISKIFRGGCIIQARLLQNIIEAYEKNPELENLIF